MKKKDFKILKKRIQIELKRNQEQPDNISAEIIAKKIAFLFENMVEQKRKIIQAQFAQQLMKITIDYEDKIKKIKIGYPNSGTENLKVKKYH